MPEAELLNKLNSPIMEPKVPGYDNSGVLDETTALAQLNRQAAQTLHQSSAPQVSDYDVGRPYGASPELQRAESQSKAAQFGNMLGNLVVGEIVGGTIEGAGYLLDVKSAFDHLGESDEAFHGFLQDLGSGIREGMKEAAPIYRDPADQGKFQPGSWSWWMDNAPTIGSSIALMIPAMGVTKLLGKGISMMPQLAKIAGSMSSTQKWLTTAAAQATISRHAENMMEAKQTYDSEYQNALQAGKKPEDAQTMASKAAALNYNANWLMVAQDFAQYALLGRSFGKAATDNTLKVVNRMGQSALPVVGKKAAAIGFDLGMEAGEEAYQFISNEESKYIIDRQYGITSEKPFSDRLIGYLEDGDFWTSAFMGALGAGAMQASGRGLKMFNKKDKDGSDLKLDDINSWGASYAKSTKQLAEAHKAGDGELVNTLLNDTVVGMGLKSAKVGNLQNHIDMLKSLQSDPSAETKKRFGFSELSDEEFETFKGRIPEMISTLERTGKVWDQTTQDFKKAGLELQFVAPTVQRMMNVELMQKSIPVYRQRAEELKKDLYGVDKLSSPGRIIFDKAVSLEAQKRALNVLKMRKGKLAESKEPVDTFYSKGVDSMIKKQEDKIKATEEEIKKLKLDNNYQPADRTADSEIMSKTLLTPKFYEYITANTIADTMEMSIARNLEEIAEHKDKKWQQERLAQVRKDEDEAKKKTEAEKKPVKEQPVEVEVKDKKTGKKTLQFADGSKVGPKAPVTVHLGKRKGNVDQGLKEAMGNAERIVLKKDGSFYYYKDDPKHTGQDSLLQRVTHYISPDMVGKESAELDTSHTFGNAIDGLVRDIMGGTFKDSTKGEYYLFADEENFKKVVKQVKKLKADIEKRGEKIIASGLTLYSEELQLAGTVDILTYNQKGEITIYDVKSMKTLDDYASKNYGQSKMEKHSNQLNLYRILLANTHGLVATKLAVIPFVLDYDVSDDLINEVVLEKEIDVKINNTVKDITLDVDPKKVGKPGVVSKATPTKGAPPKVEGTERKKQPKGKPSETPSGDMGYIPEEDGADSYENNTEELNEAVADEAADIVSRYQDKMGVIDEDALEADWKPLLDDLSDIEEISAKDRAELVHALESDLGKFAALLAYYRLVEEDGLSESALAVKDAIKDNWDSLKQTNTIRNIKNRNNRKSYQDIVEFNAAERFVPIEGDVNDLTQMDELGLASTQGLRNEEDKGIIGVNMQFKLREVKDPVGKRTVWVSDLDENNELIPVEYTEDDTLAQVDHEYLNNSQNDLRGQVVHLEIMEEDPWNKQIRKGNVAHSESQIAIVQYIDNDVNNMAPENRKILGVLPSNRNIRGRQWDRLKALRAAALAAGTKNQVKDHRGKTVTRTGIATVLTNKTPGRIMRGEFTTNWDYLVPVDKDGNQMFYLAVVETTGTNDQKKLVAPNVPAAIKESLVDNTNFLAHATPGAVYLLVPTANPGEWMPVRMFTKSIDEFPERKETLVNLLSTINEDNFEKVAAQAREICYVDLRLADEGHIIVYDSADHYTEADIMTLGKKAKGKQRAKLGGAKTIGIYYPAKPGKSFLINLADTVNINDVRDKGETAAHSFWTQILTGRPVQINKKRINSVPSRTEKNAIPYNEKVLEDELLATDLASSSDQVQAYTHSAQPVLSGEIVDPATTAKAMVVAKKNMKGPSKKATADRATNVKTKAKAQGNNNKVTKDSEKGNNSSTAGANKYVASKQLGNSRTANSSHDAKTKSNFQQLLQAGKNEQPSPTPKKAVAANSTVDYAEASKKMAQYAALESLGKSHAQIMAKLGWTEAQYKLYKDMTNVTFRLAEDEDGYPIVNDDEIAWFQANLPQVPLEIIPHVSHIIYNGGPKAWGMFVENAARVAQLGAEGTVYHEAWHVCQELFFSDKDNERIFAEAEKKYGTSDQTQLKEKLAEDFREYAQTEGKATQSLGKTISDGFKKLWIAIKMALGRTLNLNQYFFAIHRGMYKGATIRVDSKYRSTEALLRIQELRPTEEQDTIDSLNLYFFREIAERLAERGITNPTSDHYRNYILEKHPFSIYEAVINKYIVPLRNDAEEALLETVAAGKSADFLASLHTKLSAVVNGMFPDTKLGYGPLAVSCVNNLRKYGFKINLSNVNFAVDYVGGDITDELIPEAMNVDMDESARGESWAAEAGSSSMRDTMSLRIKIVINALPKQGTNWFGGEQYVDGAQAYNQLLTALSDVFEPELMFEKLENLTIAHPEFVPLVQKINTDPQFRAEFFSNFANTHVEFTFIDITPYGEHNAQIRVYAANRRGLKMMLLERWKLDMFNPRLSSIITDDGIINTTRAKVLREHNAQLQRQALRQKKNMTVAQAEILAKSWVTAVGQPMGLRIEESLVVDMLLNADSKELRRFFVEGIGRVLSTMEEGLSPFGTYTDQNGVVHGSETKETSSLLVATGLLAKFSKQMFEDGFRNAENKQVYAHRVPNNVARFIAKLNGTQEEVEAYLTSEFMNDPFFSGWQHTWKSGETEQIGVNDVLYKLIHNEAFRANFVSTLIDGLRREDERGVKYTKMGDNDLITVALNMFLNPNGAEGTAWIKVPTLSDKPSMMFVLTDMDNIFDENDKVIDTSSLLAGLENIAMQETIRNQRLLDRQAQFNSGALHISEFVSGYDLENNAIIAYIENLKANGQEEAAKDIKMRKGVDYVYFKSAPGVELEKPEDSDSNIPMAQSLLEELEFLMAASKHKNLAMDEFMFKLVTQQLEPELRDELHMWFNQFMDANYQNFFDGLLDSGVITENKTDKGEKYYESQMINLGSYASPADKPQPGKKFHAKRFSSLEHALKAYYWNTFITGSQVSQIFSADKWFYGSDEAFQKRNMQIGSPGWMIDHTASYTLTEEEAMAEAEARGEEHIGGEVTINTGSTFNFVFGLDEYVGAGQEFIDAMKEILKAEGWSDKDIELYARGFEAMIHTDGQSWVTLDRHRKVEIGLGRWSPEKQATFTKGKRGDLSANDMEVFMPRKPFYYALHHLGDIVVPTQIKNSEAVLVPQIAYKTNALGEFMYPKLARLLQFMEKTGEFADREGDVLDAVHLMSTAKVGSLTPIDLTSVDSANFSAEFIHTGMNSDYRHQQETPEHFIDEDIVSGTQIRKLILSNLLQEFGKQLNTVDGEIEVEKLVEKYQDLITADITESFNLTMGRMESIEDIQTILMDEVVRMGLDEDFANALQIKRTAEGKLVFNIPLFHPFHAYRVESMLNSIFKNSVVRQRQNGASLVQISSFGFNEHLKIKRNVDGTIAHFECYLPWWMEDYMPLDEDGEIDIQKLEQMDPEILEMVGYRIPTEGKYSMMRLKVKGFLPRFAGGTIALPAEMSKLTGADFDIDKLYIFMPNIIRKTDGTIATVKYNEGETTQDERYRYLMKEQEIAQTREGRMAIARYFRKYAESKFGIKSSSRGRQAQVDEIKMFIQIVQDFKNTTVQHLKDILARVSEQSEEYKAAKRELNMFLSWAEPRLAELNELLAPLVEENDELKEEQQEHWKNGDYRRMQYFRQLRQPLVDAIAPLKEAKFDIINHIRMLKQAFPVDQFLTRTEQVSSADVMPGEANPRTVRYRQNPTIGIEYLKAEIASFNDGMKDLRGEMDNIFRQVSMMRQEALIEGGLLPTESDFAARDEAGNYYRSIAEQNTKWARENNRLQLIKAVLSSELGTAETLAGGGFPNWEDTSNYILTLKGQSRTKLNISLPQGDLMFTSRNLAGKELVGIMANANVNHAILQYGDVRILDDKPAVEFNGKAGRNLSGISFEAYDPATGTTRKIFISKSLGTMVAMVVDNAKKPIAPFINLNTFTADLYTFILRAGHSETTAALFMTQPIIEHITKLYFKNKRKFYLEDVIRDLEFRIRKGLDLTEDDVWKRLNAQYDKARHAKRSKTDPEHGNNYYNVNDDDMAANITYALELGTSPFAKLDEELFDNKQYVDFMLGQLRILNKFAALKPGAEAIGEVIQGMRIDSVGPGPLIANNDDLISKIEKIKDLDSSINQWFSGLPDFFDKAVTPYKMLWAFTTFGLYEPTNHMTRPYPLGPDSIPVMFPWHSELFSQVNEFLLMNAAKKSAITPEYRQYINYEFLNYLMTQFKPLNFDKDKREDLIYNTVELMEDLKAKFPDFAEEPFIARLMVEVDEESGIKKLRFDNTTPMSKGEEANYRQNWQMLMESPNPEYKAMAFRLAEYAVLGGIAFGPNTFLSYLPLSYYYNELKDPDTGQTLGDFLYNQAESWMKQEVTAPDSGFIMTFLKNNYTKEGIMREVFTFVPKNKMEGKKRQLNVEVLHSGGRGLNTFPTVISPWGAHNTSNPEKQSHGAHFIIGFEPGAEPGEKLPIYAPIIKYQTYDRVGGWKTYLYSLNITEGGKPVYYLTNKLGLSNFVKEYNVNEGDLIESAVYTNQVAFEVDDASGITLPVGYKSKSFAAIESNLEPIDVWYASGENASLSNLAARPFEFEGKNYLSVEHAYQTNKSGTFDAVTYKAYKKAGVKIAGKRPANTEENWNLRLMHDLILESFVQNPTAAQALVDTGDAPITHENANDIWKDEFPRILMDVRKELQADEDYKAKDEDGEALDTPRKVHKVKPTKLNIATGSSESTSKRNYANVVKSNGVLMLASKNTATVNDIARVAKDNSKPYLAVDIGKNLKVTPTLVSQIVKWVNENGVSSLYITGDNLSTSPYEAEFLNGFMNELLGQVSTHPDLKLPIRHLQNAGESGIEEAAVFAAQSLGFRSMEIRPTSDFKFTDEQGKVIKDEKKFKARYKDNPLMNTPEDEEEVEEEIQKAKPAKGKPKAEKTTEKRKDNAIVLGKNQKAGDKKQRHTPKYKHNAYTTVYEEDFDDHKDPDIESETKFEGYASGEIKGYSTNMKQESVRDFLEERITKPGDILLLYASQDPNAEQLPLRILEVNEFDLSEMDEEELADWARAEGVKLSWARIMSRKPKARRGTQFIVEPISPEDAEPHTGKGAAWNLQLENESSEPVNKALDNKLKLFLGANGINVESADTLMERYGRDAVAVADFIERLILVAEGKADKLTLPEEAAHFAIAGMSKDDPRLEIIMNSVEETAEFAKVSAQYAEVYENNPESLRKEAAGKILAKYIVQEHEAPSNVPIRLLRALRYAWTRMMNLLKFAGHKRYVMSVNEAYQSVAREVLSGTMKLDQDNIDAEGRVYYDLPEVTKDPSKPRVTRVDLNKMQKLLEKAIRTKQKRLKIFQAQGATSTWRTGTKKSFEQTERGQISQLQKMLEAGEISKGIERYLQTIAIDLFGDTSYDKKSKAKVTLKGGMVSKLNALRTTFATRGVELETANANAKTLKLVFDFVSSHKQLVGEIRKELITMKSTGYDMDSEEVKMLSYIETYLQQMEDMYYELATELFAGVLSEYMGERNVKGVSGGLAPLNIKDVLLEANKDISFAQLYLDSLAEANDDILGMIAKMVTQAKLSAQAKAVDTRKELIRAKEELEAAGYPDTDWAFERDENGDLTGNILTEYDMGAYKQAKQSFYNAHPVPVRDDYKDAKEYYAAAKIRNKLIAEWNRKNTVPVSNWEQIVAEHKKKLSPSAFATWRNYHLQEAWGDSGDLIPRAYSMELSRPADEYRSKAYANLSEAQKKFLQTVMKVKAEVDMVMNPRFVNTYRAPQVRKDTMETFMSTEGGLGEKLKGVGRRMKEGVVRTEQDTEYGDTTRDKVILTDNRGRVVNFLPLYFIHPLKEMKDLSLDLTSTMAAYATMALDYGEMSQIINILEVGKDVIVDKRKVSMTDSMGKQIKQALGVGETREAVHKEQGTARSVTRLLAFFDMVVYGHLHKDEGSFSLGGKTRFDTAKVIDGVGKYVAINGLALNLYAGLANVGFGTIQGRIEGIAKQHFDNKDLLYADLTYTKGLPAVMGNIGVMDKDDKLSLWIERFDTLQNFEESAFDIEADRNRFSRLMKTSALFFINHAGEHYMQTRTSLALAHRTKLKDAQGNEVPLYDCFEVVGNELKLKKEFEGQFTEKDMLAFRMKTNALNKSFHGIYNKIDRSYIQQMAVGRAALMFRKFIRPGWNRRWRGKYYNYELDDVTEGYYQTMRRFLVVLANDLKQGQLAITVHWNELTDQERANMMRALAEVGYMIAFGVMSQVLISFAQGVDDDDPEGWALNMAAYQVRRQLGELRFYVPAPGFGSSDFLRILQSPAAAIQNIQQLNNTLNYIFNPTTWGDVMERGQYEGWPKVARYGIDLVPMNRTIRGLLTPEDKLKYFTKPIYN